MTPRTLPREPWKGSQICGWQISCGGWGRPMEFCAKRKGHYLYTCEEHWDELVAEGGDLAFAPGNAYGDRALAVRLLWEPYGGTEPIEPSAEEMERYAPILDLPRSV